VENHGLLPPVRTADRDEAARTLDQGRARRAERVAHKWFALPHTLTFQGYWGFAQQFERTASPIRAGVTLRDSTWFINHVAIHVWDEDGNRMVSGPVHTLKIPLAIVLRRHNRQDGSTTCEGPVRG
jgi:hypothetical protein